MTLVLYHQLVIAPRTGIKIRRGSVSKSMINIKYLGRFTLLNEENKINPKYVVLHPYSLPDRDLRPWFVKKGVYIYIYIYIRENSTYIYIYHPGWRLMRAGYRTCFHTMYDEKKIKHV